MKRTALWLGMLTVALLATAGAVSAWGAGVVATPGAKSVFTVPLDAEGIAELADNGGITSANVGLWVPAGFDPSREWNILLVSSTADGGALSVSAMDSFLPAAQSVGGWIVMAADGTTRPGYDDDPYRWAVMRAGLRALAEQWPAARGWPVAAGGFSGGAKFSGLMGGQLHKNGYTLVGMWMGGCNDDMASAAVWSYAPGEGFLDVPIFLSSGDSDPIATPYDVTWVRDSMEQTGFTTIRLETYAGAHVLCSPHVEEGLRWFVNLDGRGRTTATLDPQGGNGGKRKIDVVAGQALPAVAPPTRAGYVFTGYYSAVDGGGTQYYSAAGAGIHVWDLPAESVLYAAWTPKTYSVTLDRQGGTGGSSSVQMVYDATPPSIAAPALANHAFGGYFSGPNGTGTVYYDEEGNGIGVWDIAADATLYAYWKWTGGGDVVWEFRVENGKAVVTGASPASGRLEVPAVMDGYPVAAIGESAFFRERELTTVVLPEGVVDIGGYAFNQCNGLIAVSLPTSVTNIGELAFNLCTCLKNVSLGEGLRSLGGGAFRECDSLVSVTLPASLESLGAGSNYGVFEACDSLESINVAPGNAKFASRDGVLFTKDGKTLLQLPGAWSGAYAIPDGVTAVGVSAFSDCARLTAVSGGRDLVEIGGYAFWGCQRLESVSIPDGVVSVGTWAFIECDSLALLDVPGAWRGTSILEGTAVPSETMVRYRGTDSETVGGVAWRYSVQDGKAVVTDVDCGGAVEVPAKLGGRPVAGIGDAAFWGCSGLVSLSIPDGVESVGDCAFSGTGLAALSVPGAWYGTGMLAAAGLPEECKVTYRGIEALAVATEGLPLGVVGETYGVALAATGGKLPYSWRMAEGSAEEDWPQGLMLTAEGVLQGSPICSGVWTVAVEVSDSSGATALKTFLLEVEASGAPEVSWGYQIDSGWAYVTSAVPAQGRLVIPAALGGHPVSGIWEEAFSGASNLTEVVIPDGVSFIGNRAFLRCSGLTEVVIPDTVERIGYEAFRECGALTNVTVGTRLSSVSWGAFSYCSRLAAVHIRDLAAWCGIYFGNFDANPLWYAGHLYLDGKEVSPLAIPDGVASIGPWTFCKYTNLTDVAFPGSLTNIGYRAFSDCTGLTRVDIPDSVKGIGTSAFAWCTNMVHVALGSGLESIGEAAFVGCGGLAGLDIPDGVASIGNYAFMECAGLRKMTLPESVANVGSDAFAESGLKRLYVPASWEGTAMLDGAGVPDGCMVVYGPPTTEATASGVSFDWLDAHGLGDGTLEGYEAAAAATASNGVNTVTECYVAGIDPTSPDAAFNAKIEWVDGKPLVTPESIPTDGVPRVYKTYGRKTLTGKDEIWTDVDAVPASQAASFRFFRVGVALKE